VTFAGDARFGWAAAFARQAPELACWVRLDAPDDVVSRRAWPAEWAVVPTAERPAPDAAGAWGRLVHQPDPDPS
jgi:hypothetical protein